MKKLRIFLLAVATILGLSVPVFADSDVDYSISNYDGVLAIHDDNAADFYQTITYRFDSSYNGQVVTLGEAGQKVFRLITSQKFQLRLTVLVGRLDRW